MPRNGAFQRRDTLCKSAGRGILNALYALGQAVLCAFGTVFLATYTFTEGDLHVLRALDLSRQRGIIDLARQLLCGVLNRAVQFLRGLLQVLHLGQIRVFLTEFFAVRGFDVRPKIVVKGQLDVEHDAVDKLADFYLIAQLCSRVVQRFCCRKG